MPAWYGKWDISKGLIRMSPSGSNKVPIRASLNGSTLEIKSHDLNLTKKAKENKRILISIFDLIKKRKQ